MKGNIIFNSITLTLIAYTQDFYGKKFNFDLELYAEHNNFFLPFFQWKISFRVHEISIIFFEYRIILVRE